MPVSKFPKPFFRTGRGWYVQLGKRQVKLCDGPQNAVTQGVALERYHALMATRPAEAPRSNGGVSVAELFDKFLAWCMKHREPRTYDWYRDHLQAFLDHLGRASLEQADALKPFVVQEWVDRHASWSPAFQRGALVAVGRSFNWGVKLGHVAANPVAKIEKPTAQRRESHVTPEQWATIKARYKPDDSFLRLLEFSWEVGCRPQESKRVERRHVDLERHRVVFPKGESKGKRRPRVIRLSDRAAEILKALLEDERSGPLFVNEDANPWTNYAVASRFARLKKHLGVRLAAYDFRHGFAERLLESGADHLSVAELLGHKDGQMLATTYSHLGQADDHLREILRKGSGGA